jgi:hypothetical protein
MSSGNYIYCFIRKDLPVVQQIIQVGHACHLAGHTDKNFTDIPNLVLFEVEDEEELTRASSKIDKAGIGFVEFFEPDMDDEWTAICTEIVSSHEQRKAFRGFKLYK